MAKNKIRIGLLGDPNSFKDAVKSNGAKEYYQGKPVASEFEKRIKPGYLINRNNHPVSLSYDGETLIVPPRGRVVIANSEKLGGFAPGIVYVPDESLKN